MFTFFFEKCIILFSTLCTNNSLKVLAAFLIVNVRFFNFLNKKLMGIFLKVRVFQLK